MDYVDSMILSPEQKRAVESDADITVVVAGPGSGKTRVEVERVKYVAQGLATIAIMTFTNGAAAEFKERLGPLAENLAWCGTTHSYCFKLVNKFGYLIGYTAGSVNILPEGEKEPRLLQVKDELGSRVRKTALLLHPRVFDQEADLVWREYEFRLKQSNLIDYDGILRQGLRLLEIEEVRVRCQLDHLLVDEFQDSSAIDLAIYMTIPASSKFFVGDPDQSIYTFRQADPAGLINLALCRDVASLNLEDNYRCCPAICEVANRLIAHNKYRLPKVSKSKDVLNGQVQVDQYEDGWRELDGLAGCISMTLATEQTVAVLYRNNFEAEECSKSLVGRGLPVKMQRFNRRPADLERAIILMSLVLSPDNEILFERYLLLDHKPHEVADYLLRMKADKVPVSVKSRMLTGSDARVMLSKNGVSEATRNFIGERARMLGGDAMASELIHDLRSYDPQTEGSGQETGRHIYVGTYHSAKGREWDVVFLPAFEQGMSPSKSALTLAAPFCDYPSHQVDVPRPETEGLALEEERRLAFVAITRARHELYFSWAAEAKGKWGPRSLGKPSQFLQESGL